MEKIIKINGMSCEHCKISVEEALKNIMGVTQVQVDLSSGTAKVILNNEIADSILENAIDEIGFEVESIK